VPGSFRGHSRVVPGYFQGHSRVVPGWLPCHSGIILASCGRPWFRADVNRPFGLWFTGVLIQ